MSKPNKQRYAKGAPPIAAKDYFNALRSVRLQPPATGIFDEPTRCYKINLEWASHIEGAIEVLADWTAWLGEDDERNIAVQQIRELLKGSSCVDCNQVLECLNQNPDWISLQSITVEHMAETTEEFFAELETQYDGNPDSINPAIPVNEPALAREENALCYAIGAWVRLYCENKKVAIRQSSFLSQAWNALQNAIEYAYGAISNVTGFNVLDDLFACFVDNDTALAALDDESAKSDVICCLYGELKDIALVENSLEGAINACLGSLVGTAHDLLCLMSNDLNLQHVLNFFFIYGRSLDRQQSGEVLECECETWQQMYIEYDFTISDWGFTSSSGTWQEGIGWVANITSPSAGNYRGNMTIVKQLPAEAQIWAGGLVYSAISNCGITGHAWAYLNDGIQQGGGSIGSISNGDNIHRVWTNSTASPYNDETADEIRFNVNAADCDGIEPHGKAIIHKVRIWVDSSGVLQGIPTEVYPQGLPPNGSNSLTFWE